MKRKFFIYIVLVVSLLACSGTVPQHELLVELNELDVFDKYKHTAVLVLPSVGCSGCISSTESFVKENKFPGLLLILTNVMSRKDAEFRLDLVDPVCDYYYDAARTFFLTNDPKSIYPIIFYVNKEDVSDSKFEFIEPENPDALLNLESFLNESQ